MVVLVSSEPSATREKIKLCNTFTKEKRETARSLGRSIKYRRESLTLTNSGREIIAFLVGQYQDFASFCA